MPQRTNLNINPYYDDYDQNSNYYRVLFKPGFPVQARELTTSQSILQNQVEKFARHFFKDGSVVIPGGVSYDLDYPAVQIESTFLGLDVSAYIKNFIGKEIRGQSSGVEGRVVNVLSESESDSGNIVLYVKYTTGANDNSVAVFSDGETLIALDTITYGNTTIASGNTFANVIPDNATAIGSAAHVDRGTFFFRGFFVDVEKQSIVLDQFGDKPSYRVGLQISEEIINAKQDNTLYDNAKGFTNYAAPGADRFKIATKLVKKPLTDLNDANFVELLRLNLGVLQIVPNKPDYAVVKDYIAQRDFEKTGNFFVEPFSITFHESLNNRRGNGGLFYENQVTDQGNVPSDDLLAISVGSGKAYVKGYDIDRPIASILDVEKPRTTRRVENVNVSFTIGNSVRLTNVTGHPAIKHELELYKQRLGANGTTLVGPKIGDARVYSFQLTSGEYKDDTTQFTMYVYDLNLYSFLHLANPLSATELPAGSYIKGQSSGATGYVTAAGSGSAKIYVRDVLGTFIQGEDIWINDNVENKRRILDTRTFSSKDVKSVYQQASAKGLAADFYADLALDTVPIPGYKDSDVFTLTNAGQLTIGDKAITGITTDTLYSIKQVGFQTSTIFRVKDIAKTGKAVTLEAVTPVNGISGGGLPAATLNTTIVALSPSLANTSDDGLFAVLPTNNIASVTLEESTLEFVDQITALTTNGSGEMTITNTTGIQGALFEDFDEDRYSVVYDDGSIATLTAEKFELNSGTNTVLIKGLKANETNVVANVTMKKPKMKAKQKVLNRSKVVNIVKSSKKNSGITTGTSLLDGLQYSSFYATRVQDSEICINYPDVVEVLAVHESWDINAPTFDKINFNSIENIQQSAIIGENVVGDDSKAIARVVGKPAAAQIEFIYLTDARFALGENVQFQESKIIATIDSIVNGNYKDVTHRYSLNQHQEKSFYNYSSIQRTAVSGNPPTRQLKVVFDYYTIPAGDDGDIITVNSYPPESYRNKIPHITSRVSDRDTNWATDVLDFRPYVDVYNPDTASYPPYDFDSRNFDASDKPKILMAPGESQIVSFEYYLARKDKLFLNKNGELFVVKGQPGVGSPDDLNEDNMLLGTISYPAFCDNANMVTIDLENPRRYTFADLVKMEQRIERIEKAVSLSMLEEQTKNVDVRDANGKSRFKNGFFADNFQSNDQIDTNHPDNKCEQSTEDEGVVTPVPSNGSLKSLIVTEATTNAQTFDSTVNYTLLDNNIQKSGDLLTLKYVEEEWVKQLAATGVSNINPFNVITWAVAITLTPDIDSWTRKIYTERTIEIKGLQKQVAVVTWRWRWHRRGYWWGWWGHYWHYWAYWGGWAWGHWGGHWYGHWGWGWWGWWGYRWGWHYYGWWGWGWWLARGWWWWAPSVYYVTVDLPTPVPADTIEMTSRVDEDYMRSRNVLMTAVSCKPNTRYYHFFDGTNNLDIIPKLLEIKDVTGAFQVGETVKGTSGSASITFRVCTPNHKQGPFNNPDRAFQTNPYNSGSTIPSTYSTSSTILNVDVAAMSEEAQGAYSGYVVNDMLLVGQTSGATAKVANIRFISDNFGDIYGCFFIRDPLADPAPPNRFKTGTKQFVLNTDINDTKPIPGTTKISRGAADYKSTGVVETWRTTKYKVYYHRDPLAQSFTTDASGVYITSIDVWFYQKDNKLPVFCEIRQMQLGTPTRNVLEYSEVKLDPDQVKLVPDDGASAGDDTYKTTFTFKSPVFCSPNEEFCFVLLSESDQYEVFLARMGDKTLNYQAFGLGANSQHSKQWGAGSLFKSQNGSIWTATQEEDLTFRIKRAKFTSKSGTVYLQNPDLDVSNNYTRKLRADAFQVISRSVTIGITTVNLGTPLAGILTTGRKIGETTAAENPSSTGKSYIYGNIENVGGPIDITYGSLAGVSTVAIGGTGYIDGQYTNVELYGVSSNGDGARANIFVKGGSVTGTGVTIITAGHGYKVGDILGITTSDIGGAGAQAQIAVEKIKGIDRLFLQNVKAKEFKVGERLVYFKDDDTRVSLANTTITLSARTGPSANEGDLMLVYLPNHGMYSGSNKVVISGVADLEDATQLTANVTSSSTVVSIASTVNYETFEGMPVSATNPGYVKIDEEIIAYTSVGSGNLVISSRGVDGTIPTPHDTGETVMKYETAGVSLRRINKTHDIDPYEFDIDNYYLRIDRTESGTDRSSDGSLTNAPMLSFNKLGAVGGNNIYSTSNLLFCAINPQYRIIQPTGATSVSAQVRTITGTSPSGSEISYIDRGYQDIQLNEVNEFPDVRMIASKVNEDAYNTELFRNKSFTTAITLGTTDEYVSPALDSTIGSTDFEFYRLNKPVSDYALDGRINISGEDPHASIYVSKLINLETPSVSLKCIIEAYRPESADFRVAYAINTEGQQGEAPWRLFPGYDNLVDTDGDGIGDSVLNQINNNGRADQKIRASASGEYIQYEFNAENLQKFSAFRIKIMMSGTNAAQPPKFRSIRVIALT